MRRIAAMVLLITLVLTCILPVGVGAGQTVKVFVDDVPVAFDVQPVINRGRVLVPVRAIFEALGADVKWDGTTQTVLAVKDDTVVRLVVNRNRASKNGKDVSLEAPAIICNGRVLVPLRFSGEAFGADVQWDSETYTVTITSQEFIDAAPKEPIQMKISKAEIVGSFTDDWNGLSYEELPNGMLVFSYERFQQDSADEGLNKAGLKVFDPNKKDMHCAVETDYLPGLIKVRYFKLLSNRLLYICSTNENGKAKTVFASYDLKTGQTKEIAQLAADCWYCEISSRGEVIYNKGTALVKVGLDGKQTTLPNTQYSYGDVEWSPTGDRIAYGGTGFIYIIDTKGKQLAAIRAQDINDIRWSPDGRYITYGVDVDGGTAAGFYLATATGTSNKRLLSGESHFPACWSSDAKQLYTGDQNGTVVLNRDGTIKKDLGQAGFPEWSPNGRLLLYCLDGQLLLWDSYTDETSVLTIGAADMFSRFPDLQTWDAGSLAWGQDNQTVYIYTGRDIVKLTLREI